MSDRIYRILKPALHYTQPSMLPKLPTMYTVVNNNNKQCATGSIISNQSDEYNW